MTEDVGDVDATQQHARRVVGGEGDVAIVVMPIVGLEGNDLIRRRLLHGRGDPKTA